MAEDKNKAPSQPTIQVRQPPSTSTKTINTNDPVTNEAEERLAAEAQAGGDEEAKRIQKEQEEQAKKEAENHQKKVDLTTEIFNSDEGFITRSEENDEAFTLALQDGLVYEQNVQSGKGGLDVEERVFLSEKGYSNLRNVYGDKQLTSKKK